MMATTADVPSRERERKRRKKRASMELEERETNNFEKHNTHSVPEHLPLHDLVDGADKALVQNPQSASNNSAEGSFGIPQGDRKSAARSRRPKRRTKMENGEMYDEDPYSHEPPVERKRHNRRPPSGVRHAVRRSASAEIIGAYEDYAINGETQSPNRRRPRRKRVHGSREFGEGDEFGDEPQGVNTLNREHRDYEKRTKPRKHKAKKATSFRVQNITSAEEDNYNADVDGEVSEAFFKVDKEDIVTEEPSQSSTTASVPVPLPPTANAPQAIPSQPLDVVFIERMDGHGFRSERKSRLAQAEAEINDKLPAKNTRQTTTAEFALSVHKAFRSFSLFCHGLLAGMALAQCIFVYSLSGHPSGDTVFLTYYHKLAQPVQSLYYMLFAICTVSVFDRYDMANPRSGFFQGLLTRPSRILSISAYLFSLVFSISVANIDDRISLYSSQKEKLWKEDETDSLLETWRIINLMRVLGAVLGWVLISMQPSKDYTAQNLYTDVDPVGGGESTRSRPSAEARQPQLA